MTPDKFDMVITKVDPYTDNMSNQAIIIKGTIVKKSLLRRKLITGAVFVEKLRTAHIRELLVPALKELKMQDTEELIGTVQHMQSQRLPYPPYNMYPRWLPHH